MEKRERTSRAEWQKRIERWNDSGLSAEQFAAELGINAGTLRHWKYFLGKQGGRAAKIKAPMASASALVEVQTSSIVATASPSPFELELERRGSPVLATGSRALRRVIASISYALRRYRTYRPLWSKCMSVAQSGSPA